MASEANSEKKRQTKQVANKKYYAENTQKLKEKYKKYYDENSEKIKKEKAEYYEKNKDTILEKKSKKFVCECGSNISRGSKARHNRSKKHQDYIKTLE